METNPTVAGSERSPSRKYLIRAALVVLGTLLLFFLIIERVWTGMAWDSTFRAGMTYGAETASQYTRHHAKSGEWPAQNQIVTRLQFIGTTNRPDRRIDRYACGPYAGYVLEAHLLNNGRAEFYCWRRAEEE